MQFQDRIATAEGYITFTGSTPVYQYYLRDHLGNVRTVFSASGGTATTTQQQEYYPFGLRKSLAGSGVNAYLYNGKELQGELGQYDYGARLYDPVVGRWNVVDPLGENHYGVSPYAYVLNNPIQFMDLWGLDTLSVHEFKMSTYKVGEDVVQLDAVTVIGRNFSENRYYGGDGSGSFSDKFMYGMYHVNQYNPITHAINTVTYAFTGRDYMGNPMTQAEATLGAISIVPVGRVAGVAVKGVSRVAAKGGKELFKFTGTAAKHMDEAGRMIPIQTLDDIIKAPMSVVKDPQGTKALMHYSQMWKNGKLYNVEVLYDKGANTIMHFKYTQKPLGSLPAIK